MKKLTLFLLGLFCSNLTIAAPQKKWVEVVQMVTQPVGVIIV